MIGSTKATLRKQTAGPEHVGDGVAAVSCPGASGHRSEPRLAGAHDRGIWILGSAAQ